MTRPARKPKRSKALLPFMRRIPRNARIVSWEVPCDRAPPRQTEWGEVDRRKERTR
jgi:hypothetical protein